MLSRDRFYTRHDPNGEADRRNRNQWRFNGTTTQLIAARNRIYLPAYDSDSLRATGWTYVSDGHPPAWTYERRFPEMDFNIDDIRKMVIERIDLLQWVNGLKKISFPYDPTSIIDVTYNPNNHHFIEKLKDNHMDDVARDELSHILLRMAMCHNEQHSNWLVQSEVKLARIRFNKADTDQKRAFVATVSRELNEPENCAHFQEFHEHLFDEHHTDVPELHRFVMGAKDYTFDDPNRYQPRPAHRSFIPALDEHSATPKWVPFRRIPFDQCTFLVGKRGVLLHKGDAFVPNYLYHTVAMEKYHRMLSDKLSSMRRKRQIGDGDGDDESENELNKIKYILDGDALYALVTRKDGVDDDVKECGDAMGDVKYTDVVSRLRLSFPLCQRVLLDQLVKGKQLKNNARHQLIHFLKATGLQRDEAMRFWKRFAPTTDYKRHVHYQYNRKEPAGISCATLINGCNGCPFQRMRGDENENELAAVIHKLYAGQLSLSVDEIRNQVLREHREIHRNESDVYSRQCQRLFKAAHLQNIRTTEHEMVDIEDLHLDWRFPAQYFQKAYRIAHGENLCTANQT